MTPDSVCWRMTARIEPVTFAAVVAGFDDLRRRAPHSRDRAQSRSRRRRHRRRARLTPMK